MPTNWIDRSLDNPAMDMRCAEPLESFVRKLGRDLRPGGDVKCSQEEIARMLCRTFNLKPPILGEKIRTFLEMAGIYHEVSPCSGETTFIPNRKMSRWEIYTRPCQTYEWSRDLWHEVWEVLFWRCYYLIPWWKEWAAQNGCYTPHKKADEFAYHVLISPQSAPAQSKKRQYDLYEVAKHYSVPTNLAFRALHSHTRFPHPLIFAVLRLDVRPATPAQASLTDLFGEAEQSSNVIHAQVYNKAHKAKYDPNAEPPLNAEQREAWRAIEKSFESLSKHLRREAILQIDANDPIYRYSRQPDPRQWNVRHLFGLDFPAEVAVITRQSPRCSDEIFLQIVPPGEAATFLPVPDKPSSTEELLQHIVHSEWRQAAQGVKNGTTKRLAMPGC